MEFIRAAPYYLDRINLTTAISERDDGRRLRGWHDVLRYYRSLDGIEVVDIGVGFRPPGVRRHVASVSVMHMYGLEAVLIDDLNAADMFDVAYHLVPEDVMQFWRDIMKTGVGADGRYPTVVENNVLFQVLPNTVAGLSP